MTDEQRKIFFVLLSFFFITFAPIFYYLCIIKNVTILCMNVRYTIRKRTKMFGWIWLLQWKETSSRFMKVWKAWWMRLNLQVWIWHIFPHIIRIITIATPAQEKEQYAQDSKQNADYNYNIIFSSMKFLYCLFFSCLSFNSEIYYKKVQRHFRVYCSYLLLTR
jgi:hypothetical protein